MASFSTKFHPQIVLGPVSHRKRRCPRNNTKTNRKSIKMPFGHPQNDPKSTQVDPKRRLFRSADLRSHQDHSKIVPSPVQERLRPHKASLGSLQERPKTRQDHPKSAPDPPKSTQDRPGGQAKIFQRGGVGGQERPKTPKSPLRNLQNSPKCPQEPPRSPQDPRRCSQEIQKSPRDTAPCLWDGFVCILYK